jgi:hypothetical protein
VRALYHFIVSCLVGLTALIVTKQYLVMLLTILVGSGIDVDHVFESWVDNKRFPHSYKDLFYQKPNIYRFYCFLHFYELIPILFVIFPLLNSSLAFVPLGYSLHLAFDGMTNQNGKIWKLYSLTYSLVKHKRFWDGKDEL